MRWLRHREVKWRAQSDMMGKWPRWDTSSGLFGPQSSCTFYDTFLCPYCLCGSWIIACCTLGWPEGFWSSSQKLNHTECLKSVSAAFLPAFVLQHPCVGSCTCFRPVCPGWRIGCSSQPQPSVHCSDEAAVPLGLWLMILFQGVAGSAAQGRAWPTPFGSRDTFILGIIDSHPFLSIIILFNHVIKI